MDRYAKYAAKRLADSFCQHVGTVGKRHEFDITVERVHSYETDYGMTHVNVCRDASNNIVVYKGSNEWYKGDRLVVKATVKEHSDYEGVKQTVIQRPKVIKQLNADGSPVEVQMLDQWGKPV